MDLSNFTIGSACLDEDKIYLGKLSKDRKTWLHKKDITSEFMHTIIAWVGENQKRDVTGKNGKKLYEITVKKF